MASRHREVVIRKRISAKSDEYYDEIKALGEIASQAFGKQNKSQISNLENVANSAVRVADVLDFIKRQTGRSKPAKQWSYLGFGHKLLQKLDESIRKDAQIIVKTLEPQTSSAELETDDLRRIHILLCREFIHHLSAHYHYTAVRP